jgi:hypothetical protein
VHETGTFRVNAPAHEAFVLFTPLGERRWAEGWEPTFPAHTTDHSAPGTVFTTRHGGHETIWVVTAREPGVLIAYTRVTPHHRAGTIQVRCADTGDNTTLVEVEYHLTPLGASDDSPFAEGYAAYLRTWEERIAEALGSP